MCVIVCVCLLRVPFLGVEGNQKESSPILGGSPFGDTKFLNQAQHVDDWKVQEGSDWLFELF